jgi:hypothetical protein
MRLTRSSFGGLINNFAKNPCIYSDVLTGVLTVGLRIGSRRFLVPISIETVRNRS